LKYGVAYWYQFFWHVKVWPSSLVISLDHRDITGMLLIADKMHMLRCLWWILQQEMVNQEVSVTKSSLTYSSSKTRYAFTFYLLSWLWGPMGVTEAGGILPPFLGLFCTLLWLSVEHLNLGRGVCANPKLKAKFPSLWIYCHLRRYHIDTFVIKKVLKSSSYTYDQSN